MIRLDLDVVDLLKRLGIGARRSGSELRGDCPNPAHANRREFSNGKGPGSCQYVLCGEKAAHFYCYSCSAGGGAVTLVRMALALDGPTAWRWLLDFAGVSAPVGATPLAWKEKCAADDRNLVFPFGSAPLWSEDAHRAVDAASALSYLLNRGVSLREIEHHRMLAVPLTGRAYSGRVIVPVVVQDRLVDFVARLYAKASPKIPKALSGRRDNGARKELSLFGYDDLDPPVVSDVVYVCEGVWGALALRRIGVPNVLAACGSAWSEERSALLAPWPRIFFVPDADPAGRKLVQRASSLRFSHEVFHVVLPEGGQPDTVPPADVHRAIARAKPASYVRASHAPQVSQWTGKS